MRLSDYVASWLATVNPRVYTVCGAGAMYLNDAICHHSGLKVLAMHHEQAATFAAEADARVSGLPGIVSVTAGPGGTNAMTGLASAYVDSIPLIVIAGQVKKSTMANADKLHTRRGHGVRQLGVNELDMVELVRPVTKYAATVFEPAMIRYHLEHAYSSAMMGRRGPVFLEIPLDVQNAEIDPSNYPPLHERTGETNQRTHFCSVDDITRCVHMLNEAERPVLIIGNGIHLAGAEDELWQLVDALAIPVISSWNAGDILPEHPYHIGHCGLFGDRASNFTVQNADLILAIGTRLSIPQIGHAPELFAPNAKKIVVDIDYEEAIKDTLKADLPIGADAKEFIATFRKSAWEAKRIFAWPEWRTQCQEWKAKYAVMLPEYRETKDGVNSYFFMEQLAKHLDDDAIIVTDVGFGFISAMQALPLRGKQRLFHSGGVSAMGYGLPAAIGACFAGGGRQVVCLTGDGGLMFNIQELQTIAHHKLPIAIFVFCNNGYSTMQITQNNHFGREAVSSPTSGVSCPDFESVARSFKFTTWSAHDKRDLDTLFYMALDKGVPGPALAQVYLPEGQVLAPRVQTKMVGGKFAPATLDTMWPPLDEQESAA